jgi:hypothetical protein
METFLFDYCPSETLRREVRRRGLTIVGHLGTCEHPKHPGDLGWTMTPFMADENPVWALDVRGGAEVIWECDRPAFNAKLREYGKRPDQIRRTSLNTAITVGVYDQEGKSVCTTRHAEVVASYLGSVDLNGNWKYSVGVPNAIIVSAMIEFAAQRDAKPYALPLDIQKNHGILRFLEAALSLPEREDRGCLDQLHLHLATEPSVLQIHAELLGPDATTEEAWAMVRALERCGYSAELGDPGARHPTKAGIRQDTWRCLLQEIKNLRLSV